MLISSLKARLGTLFRSWVRCEADGLRVCRICGLQGFENVELCPQTTGLAARSKGRSREEVVAAALIFLLILILW